MPGTYVLDKIILRSGNLSLVYESTQMPVHHGLSVSDKTVTSGPIVCYAGAQNLSATLRTYRENVVGRQKFLELILHSGRNHVREGEIRFRSASAGLRLRTTEVSLVDCPDVHLRDVSKPGIVQVANIPAGTKMSMLIPYTIDNDMGELSVRIEVEYTSRNVNYIFSRSCSILTQLPFIVKVYDIFRGVA
jgi:hypothetical protein